MSVRIGTNVASLAAQIQLRKASRSTQHALMALSSGHRIVQAGDDVASQAIGDMLKAQMSGIKQGELNARNATSFIQVAEGALNTQNDILIRMRELAVEAASDTVGRRERHYLNREFQQLSQEVDRVAKTARFGGRQLLTGKSSNLQFQVGPYGTKEDRISYRLDANTQSSSLGVDDLDISGRGDASDSLESIDDAIRHIEGYRADFGAIQERLQYAASSSDTAYENIAQARSRLVDADVASESANLVKGEIMQNLSTAVLAQANQEPNRAVKLLTS